MGWGGWCEDTLVFGVHDTPACIHNTARSLLGWQVSVLVWEIKGRERNREST